jgi:hypothetical protein
MSMKRTSRECAMSLLLAADRKRTWTPEERRLFATAFNALQKLAGKKTRMVRGKLNSGR